MSQTENVYVKTYTFMSGDDRPECVFGPFDLTGDDATELVKQLAVTGRYKKVLIERGTPAEVQVLVDGRPVATGSIHG